MQIFPMKSVNIVVLRFEPEEVRYIVPDGGASMSAIAAREADL